MPAQQAVAGRFTETIVSGFDVYKPEVLNGLINAHGNQGQTWFMTMSMLGFEKAVAADTYYWYESDLWNPPFKSAGNVGAPGTGNPLLITIDPSSLDANNNFYPRQWFIVNFKGGKRGLISSIDVSTPSAPVLTIVPIQAGAAYALPAVATGEEMSVTSSAFAEGTGQPKGVVQGATKRSNTLQILKETMSGTGSEITNQTWMSDWADVSDLVGTNGAAKSWYNLNFVSMDYRMALQASDVLLFGQSSDGSIIDSSVNAATKMSTGLVPAMKSLAIQDSYTSGSFTVVDFDRIGRLLQRQYSSNIVGAHFGENLYQDFENGLVTFLSGSFVKYDEQVTNQIVSTTLGVNKNSAPDQIANAKAVSVNFKSIVKNERKYLVNKVNEFSNPQTYGLPGSVTPGYGMFIPMGKKVKDPVSGEWGDYIGSRYKKLGSYSRKMQIWDVNGASGNLITEFDIDNAYCRSHIGAQQMAVNQMLFLTPQ